MQLGLRVALAKKICSRGYLKRGRLNAGYTVLAGLP